MLKEIILSTIRDDSITLENIYNFFTYLEQLKTDDSLDAHFACFMQYFSCALEHLEPLISDIEFEYIKFDNK